MNVPVSNKKFIFICGLHRSGTSVLHELLKAQNQISGFSNTGFPEDEGQFLQSVYKPAFHYGGPGKFGFDPQAALREDSPLVSRENSSKLLNEWARHWDMSKPLLVEKSPPNLIRTRFLQQLFPASYFIILMRHPVAVAEATKKWTKTNRASLIKHWLVCHQILKNDAPHLHNKICITYEAMVEQPEQLCQLLSVFLGVEIQYTGGMVNKNKVYFNQWKRPYWNLYRLIEREWITKKYEKELNAFNYSFKDIDL